ncbi:MAG: protein kinase [Isosphaeraceae bacterium]
MAVDPARAKSLFLNASDRADPAERAAYLDRECGGDAELRARVEALLRAEVAPLAVGDSLPEPQEDATGAFLPEGPNPTEAATGEHPPDAPPETIDHADPEATAARESASPPTDPDATEARQSGSAPPRAARPANDKAIGTVIAGRYTLVEVIGEGGMGSVYLAEQTRPVRRQVALKLIKTGMDSRAGLARFDAERQALALMDHPNIARIYDGGVTPSGQPFFVMELVQGVPLTEYCDRQRLSVKSRLELFVAVCQAVQHAHQKGIIHRDLKPGNVLVTEVDGRPTPKVIDFGVAKATEQDLTDMSFADTGAIVGTPTYMSPEQADPSSMDIDTRTDVYALGVMLYELLTGSPPLDARQFQRGAVLEMLRMVREVDPPRPSTKLSTAEALPNIAAKPSIEPGRLSKLLQGARLGGDEGPGKRPQPAVRHGQRLRPRHPAVPGRRGCRGPAAEPGLSTPEIRQAEQDPGDRGQPAPARVAGRDRRHFVGDEGSEPGPGGRAEAGRWRTRCQGRRPAGSGRGSRTARQGDRGRSPDQDHQ